MMLFETKTLLSTAAICLCLSIGASQAQENAQLQLSPALVECYNTSFFMNRDNRLPANIDTLISIIEKVENSYGFSMDMRQLATSLLYRFRQDGIQRAPGVSLQAGVIPYSPTGFQFPKFRLLLTRLLSSSGLQFPNDTLTSVERCSLHFMLSSSFDLRVRGDESQVCNNLAQYRAERLPRDLRQTETNFLGMVEVFDDAQKRLATRGAPSAATSKRGSNLNYEDYDSDWAYAGSEGTISQCPVEDGVVRTKWGTINAGTLLAGIATGLQPQGVGLQTLLKLGRRPGRLLPQTSSANIDNRWAATLAGDLAEVALVQMPVSQSSSAVVGAPGGWNDTVLPHWYFLSQRTNLEDTDAEIRGGLDGIIIAKNIINWRTQASNMKLSQLLRMYYSLGGVLNSGLMACNRRDNYPTYAPSSEMTLQSGLFAQVLDQEMQLKVTLTASAITNFTNMASSALITYIPQSLNDVACTASTSQDLTDSITPMTTIYVFLDTSWQYSTVVDYVTYVIQQLNVHPYASNVTMLSAYDGSVIVNMTNSITDFYQQWTALTHATYTQGFNLPNVLRTIQNLTQNLMNQEKANSSLSAHSLVALIVPNTATVNDGDSSYSTTEVQYINEQIPDLRFIYYGGGSIQRFSSFVRDSTQDLFSLVTGTNVATSAGPVAKRIIQIPRRIINPRCGSSWITPNWGTDQIPQYERPGIINFYRIVSNYFYGAGQNRYVTVQSQSGGQFTVCTSRTTAWPMQNSTNSSLSSSNTGNDVTCVQISGNSFSYDVSNACNGYNTIHDCPPLYFSVQSASIANGGQTTVSCTDAACQTPDQWRFVVSVTNMGCYSGVAGLVASLATIILAFVLHQTLQ